MLASGQSDMPEVCVVYQETRADVLTLQTIRFVRNPYKLSEGARTRATRQRQIAM